MPRRSFVGGYPDWIRTVIRSATATLDPLPAGAHQDDHLHLNGFFSFLHQSWMLPISNGVQVELTLQVTLKKGEQLPLL